MFVGPANEYSRSHAAHTAAGTSARLSADCLPRHEPLTEVRRQLAHIETRSAGALLNPAGFVDRVAFAANAAHGSVDADVPPARPLSSIARLSLAESQAASATNNNNGAGNNNNNRSRAARGGGVGSGFSEGAVEVFLAGIGVDLREQTRQMQHVSAMRSHASIAGSPRSLYGAGGAGGGAKLAGDGFGLGGGDGSGPSAHLLQPQAGDLDQIVRNRRQDSLGAAIYDVSKTMSSREMLTLRTGLGGGSTSSVMRAPSTDAMLLAGSGLLHGSGAGGGASNMGTPRAAPLSGALKSIGNSNNATTATPHSAVAAAASAPESARMHSNVQEGIERANRFASVVASFAPAEWLGRFSGVASKSIEDVSANSTSGSNIERALDLADVWTNVRRILYHVPVANNNNSSRNSSTSSKRVHNNSGAGLHPTLVAVSGARSSLEHNFFATLLTQIGMQSGSGKNIDPTQVPDLITKYCSSGRSARAPVEVSVWTKIFFAMRSGQWRAAAAISAGARDPVVSGSVAAAIRDDVRGNGPAPSAAFVGGSNDDDGGMSMNRIAVAQHASLDDLRKLYENEATRTDPYRACVLFQLLRGRIGARLAAVLATQQQKSGANNNNNNNTSVNKDEKTVAVAELDDIIKRVSHSIEDVLWIRMSLVECISMSSNSNDSTAPAAPALTGAGGDAEKKQEQQQQLGGPSMLPFHALRDVQASILAENPATLACNVFDNNKERLANFYFLALLPATACRALLSPSAGGGGGASSIDAVHFAAVFQQRGILPSSSSSSSAEAPLHIESALRSFVCSYVTVRTGGPARCDAPLLHVAYSYFRAVDLEQAFVNLCASDDVFAARIFSPLVPSSASLSGGGGNNNSQQQQLQLLAEAATGEHTLSAAASNIELLQLLDRVGMQAMLNSKTTLCAQVSLIQYANAAQLGRRAQYRNDATVDSLCIDAVTRTYASLTPILQSAVLRAVSARCALVRPSTEFVVDGGVVSGSTGGSNAAIPVDLVQAARTVSAVVEAIGPISIHQATGGQLSNLMCRFSATLGLVDLLAAWDDRDDAAVARIFFGVSYVPTTPAQVDACCQRLNTAGEALILLMSRVYLLVQHSLQRQRRSLLAQGNSNNTGGDELGLSRVDAQAELLEQWFERWSQRCKGAIAGTIKA